MSARHGPWELLHLDGDPVPADREDARSHAGAARRRSNRLAELSDTLRRLSNLDGWHGEAAQGFASRAGELVDDLHAAHERYAGLADALDAWAEDVDSARDRTQTALSHAVSADSDIRRHTVDPVPGPEPTLESLEAQRTADRLRSDAESALDSARRMLLDALHDLDEAASRASDRIRDAAESDHDHWHDDLEGAIREYADVIDQIRSVLEKIGMVIGAIAIVLAIFATGGAALALVPLLFWAGVALSATVLAGHTALVLSESDRAGWGDVAWDVVGLALTFNNALHTTNPRNGRRVWTEDIIRGAESEAGSVTSSVKVLEALSSTRPRAALTQGRELARLQALLAEMNRLGPSADELRIIRAAQLQLWGRIAGSVGGNVPLIKDLPDKPGKISEMSDFTIEHTHDYLASPRRWLLAPVR